MQRSLVQVLEQDQHARLVNSLLDYIHQREKVTKDGCPLLLLYPFIKERKLSCPWLIETLGELRMGGAVREERCHYKVLGYGCQAGDSDPLYDVSRQ